MRFHFPGKASIAPDGLSGTALVSQSMHNGTNLGASESRRRFFSERCKRKQALSDGPGSGPATRATCNLHKGNHQRNTANRTLLQLVTDSLQPGVTCLSKTVHTDYRPPSALEMAPTHDFVARGRKTSHICHSRAACKSASP